MLAPTKYPLLLLLFTLILATMTHAAPAAAALERRENPEPYEEGLRQNVKVITNMEEKLEEDEEPGAYKKIFRKIRTTYRRLKEKEEASGKKDTSRVAEKVRKWYKWMIDVKAGKKLQKPNPNERRPDDE